MRPAHAIPVAFLIGACIAFVDLRGALLHYSHDMAQWLYYTGLEGLTLQASFLLACGEKRAWWRNLLLFGSVFLAMQSLWNMVYAMIAFYTGTLAFPLDLGLGNFVNEGQYFIGIMVQMLVSIVLYLAYRLA